MIAAGIEFEEVGQGEPVICLHGIGGGAASFEPQMQAATGKFAGFRILSWNMPGYADSEAAVWPPTFASLSDALARLIAELDLGTVHLVGQSIGGMVALDHALRRPDQVSSLTLIGTTPAFGGRDDSFKEAFLKARLAPLEAGKTMPELAAAAAPRLVGPNPPKEVLDDVAAPMARVAERTWRGILECLVTFNRRDDLARVAQPVCLIAGAHDKNAPARTMEKMATKLPRAEYHLIESAGHMINQEAPEETNAIIKDFLRRHPI